MTSVPLYNKIVTLCSLCLSHSCSPLTPYFKYCIPFSFSLYSKLFFFSLSSLFHLPCTSLPPFLRSLSPSLSPLTRWLYLSLSLSLQDWSGNCVVCLIYNFHGGRQPKHPQLVVSTKCLCVCVSHTLSFYFSFSLCRI